MNSHKSFIYSLESIDQVADALLFQYPKSMKWAFYGSIGMGKTTLIKVLAKKLGSIDEGSSPTFAIANQYQSHSSGLIYHLDLFRLKSIHEAFNAGIHELIHSDNAHCFVEWPELITDWMDDTWMKIEFSRLEENTRLIRILPF